LFETGVFGTTLFGGHKRL